jgi:polysaccharide biosynthesis protein PslH
VHPVLKQVPGYELVVAGSTRNQIPGRVFAEELKSQTRCTIHVDIEDPTPLYDECAVFVNPMRAGAGVKLKSIHAIERGIPIVSTSVGNDGTGFHDAEHLKIADTADDFIESLTELLNDREMRIRLAERAHRRLMERYDAAGNIASLMDHWMGSRTCCKAAV